MNKQTFRDDSDYYSLETPWAYANCNIFERIFQLNEEFDRLVHCLEELEDIRTACRDKGTEAISTSWDISKHILRLMESAEVFEYNFQELARSSWFGGFTQDVAHAYWRIEEGRFNDAHKDEDVLRKLLGEVDDILSNTSDSNNQGVSLRLYDFFRFYASDLHPDHSLESYESDIYEVRDLYCMGYYSTALLVMGRAVEKSLLELGNVRQVESIRAYGQTHSWENAKFYFRNNALHEVDLPGRHGKVITQKEYHVIAILIDYRNNVAHTEYDSITRKEARRQIHSAFDLLQILVEKINYLRDLDSEEIVPVEGQKAQ